MWFFLAFFAKNLERLIPQYRNFPQREIRCFRKNLENKIFMVAAVDAQLLIGFWRSDQSQSTTPGQPTNGAPVFEYFLSETIHAQENGSRGTHFAKFLISNLLKGLTYGAVILSWNRRKSAKTNDHLILLGRILIKPAKYFQSDQSTLNWDQFLCWSPKMAPSLPKSGYWGHPTATIDWCEQNYQVSLFFSIAKITWVGAPRLAFSRKCTPNPSVVWHFRFL